MLGFQRKVHIKVHFTVATPAFTAALGQYVVDVLLKISLLLHRLGIIFLSSKDVVEDVVAKYATSSAGKILCFFVRQQVRELFDVGTKEDILVFPLALYSGILEQG